MSIGERIKEIRKAKGYSQKQLAELIGVSNSRLNNWENNLNTPSADTYIPLICKALDIDANTLLGWENEEEIKAEAQALATTVVKNQKIQKMVELLSNMSDENIDFVISFIEKLNK